MGYEKREPWARARLLGRLAFERHRDRDGDRCRVRGAVRDGRVKRHDDVEVAHVLRAWRWSVRSRRRSVLLLARSKLHGRQLDRLVRMVWTKE